MTALEQPSESAADDPPAIEHGATSRQRYGRPGVLARVLSGVARVLDGLVSRGEGLDAQGDPFGPPLADEAVAAALARIRDGRAEPHVHLAPGPGTRWVVVGHHYGAERTVLAVHRRAWRQHGWGVATLWLPYHGPRTLDGRPQGWGFVRADLASTATAVADGAEETVALARRLRAEGATEVVGLGLSLGGAVIGLAAACGARFDALGFVAAVDGCGSFYRTGANREARRRTLLAEGYDTARVDAAFRPLAPSSFPPPLPPEQILFAIPPEDLVVPPETQEAWRGTWGGRALPMRGHGHVTALASPRVASRVAAALGEALRGIEKRE